MELNFKLREAQMVKTKADTIYEHSKYEAKSAIDEFE